MAKQQQLEILIDRHKIMDAITALESMLPIVAGYNLRNCNETTETGEKCFRETTRILNELLLDISGGRHGW